MSISTRQRAGERAARWYGPFVASGARHGAKLRDVALRCAALALAYFVGAKLGLRLAYSNENVTTVWPPTGIAVAALFLFGPAVWPGVAVGAIAANLSNGAPLPTSLGIAVGNTLAPVAGAALLRRAGARPGLDRVYDVAWLACGAGLACMLLSATGGATSLVATGQLPAREYGSTWLTWWVGDALGVVLFAPPLLIFGSTRSAWHLFRERRGEAITLFVAAAVATVLVFATHIRLAYLVFPFSIWAALRFFQAGAASIAVVTAAIAILQTATGNGPFTGLSRTSNLASLQAFNATLGITSLVLAAIARERNRVQGALRDLADDLEERVEERTQELAASEAHLRESTRRLQLLDEFKDSLLTAVSHELRTPLTVIMGLTSTLAVESFPLDAGERTELIARLHANALRLDRLLADLLDVDRLNRGVVEPHVSATPVGPTVRRVLDGMDMKDHDVRVDVGPLVVAADTAHLERIVENLLSNAAKHTPPGTTVHVRSEESPDGAVLIIEDTGPGVPAAVRETIFEPFRRGDASSHVQGTGVGLSLVARFAHVNGGRAWVEERPGGGASFRVVLPHVVEESRQNA